MTRTPRPIPVPGSPEISAGAHIPALDAIRGVAILSVMLYHFNQGVRGTGLAGEAFSKVCRLGGSGVDLFFVLSGFLITGILLDTRESPRYFRNFYIRRSLRIFPLYYGVLAVACALLPARGWEVEPEATRHQGWLWLYGANVLQAMRNAYVFGHLDHFWSLAVEEHFYLVWPLILLVCGRSKGIAACLACIAIAPACRAGLVLEGDRAVAAYVATPCRIDALAMGALIAFGARAPGGIARLVPLAIGGLAASGAALAYLFAAKIDLARMDGTVLVLRGTISACCFAAIVVLAVAARPGSLVGRLSGLGTLRFLGKYSYGLYVFHYPLMPLFDRLFPREVLSARLGSVLLGQLAYSGLAIGASVGAALLSWHLFEKHFLRLKDRLAPKAGPVEGVRRAEVPLVAPSGT